MGCLICTDMESRCDLEEHRLLCVFCRQSDGSFFGTRLLLPWRSGRQPSGVRNGLSHEKGKIMPFTREPVRMSGVLRGEGQKAECIVSALRVTLEGTRLFKDCQLSIDWVSKDLPDGEYKLSFDDKAIDLRWCNGGWQKTGV